MHSTRCAADELSAELDRISAITPGALQNFRALLTTGKMGAPSSNLAQSKALIGLAMAVAQRCDCCIDRQARCAVISRIDRGQIVTAIRRAILMADGPALAYGAHALTTFDKLSAQSIGRSKQPCTDESRQPLTDKPEEQPCFTAQTASGQSDVNQRSGNMAYGCEKRSHRHYTVGRC